VVAISRGCDVRQLGMAWLVNPGGTRKDAVPQENR
jgi:hypothetical protein